MTKNVLQTKASYLTAENGVFSLVILNHWKVVKADNFQPETCVDWTCLFGERVEAANRDGTFQETTQALVLGLEVLDEALLLQDQQPQLVYLGNDETNSKCKIVSVEYPCWRLL